jgi:hypothetical protein
MAVQLNHTIVSAHDKQVSADFLAEILGLSTPAPFGPFLTVQADNEVTLDFIDSGGEIVSQHYAFLVGSASGTCRTGPIPTIASPARSTPGTAGAACTSMTRTATTSKS